MTPSRSRFPLVRRILAGFFLGIAFGLAASRFAPEALPGMLAVVSPFGAVLVSMLKMVVYPIIFFSLVLGTASMPLRSSGRIGGAVVAWYFATSLVATVFGVAMALALDPAMTAAAETAGRYMDGVKALSASSAPEGFGAFLTGLFGNPFAALAEGRFLPIIVFAILFGLAARTMLDEGKNRASVEAMLRTCDGVQHAAFKLIDWVMAYFPFGVFALTFCNFAENGTLLFGPYLRIVFCILAGVSAMILAVYPLAVALLCRENPYRVLFRLRQALLTAFVTRSSAATLPVSFRAMDEVGVPRSLSSF